MRTKPCTAAETVGALGAHAGALDEAVGILNGRQLRGRDYDLHARRQEQVERVEAGAGAQVEDDDIRVRLLEVADELQLLRVFRVRGADRVAGGVDQRQAVKARRSRYLRELLLVALQEGLERGARSLDPEQRMLVGAAEVGVDQQALESTARHRDGEVRRQDALAHTALAAGDCPNIRAFRGGRLERAPGGKRTFGLRQMRLGLGNVHRFAP